MMRLALLLSLFAQQAMGFTLISLSLSPATPLVWYEAKGPGTGPFGTFSAYNAMTANSAHVVVQNRFYQRIMPARLAFTTTTVGVGAGNATVTAYDNTAAAVMCSLTVPCVGSAGGTTGADCLAGGTASAAAASDIRLRIDGTSCTTTPLGNVSLEYTEALAEEGVDFIPRFIPLGNFGLDGGGTYPGNDSYQFDSITCGWGSAGVVSGGTDVMRVQLIQKSDAGVVCTCDLPGTCADAQMTEHTCTCSGGMKYIGAQTQPGYEMGPGYAIQLSTDTNCAINPRGFVCAIPFRR